VLAVNRIGFVPIQDFANHLTMAGDEDVDDASDLADVPAGQQGGAEELRRRDGEVVLSTILACKGMRSAQLQTLLSLCVV
jgi:hypothetical protein